MFRKILFKLDEFYIGLILSLFFAVFVYLAEQPNFKIPFFDTIGLKILDKKFELNEGAPKGDEVVIVALDQRSLDKFKKWPFKRQVFTQAMNELSELGAKVIGFDIIFTPEIDKDFSLVFDSLKSYASENIKDKKKEELSNVVASVEKQFHGDTDFNEAVKKFKNVVFGYTFLKHEDLFLVGVDSYEPQEGFKGTTLTQKFYLDDIKNLPLNDAIGFRQSILSVSGSSDYSGFINIETDWDGVNRMIPLVYRYEEELYPHFAFLVTSLFLKDKGGETGIKIDEGKDLKVKIGGIDIPIDDQGYLRINYYGPSGKFKTISMVDLLDKKVKRKDFEGKIVLVGAVASILHDLKTTPFDPKTPGVEIHATIIDNILHKNFISRSGAGILLFEALLAVLFGMIIGIVMKSLPLWTGVPLIGALFVGYLGFDIFYVFPKGKILIVLIPLIEMITIYVAIGLFKFTVVEARAKDIKSKFKHYVADAVVDEMIEKEDLNLGMKRKNLTVLFSDIRDFTTISEKLEPEVLEKLLNRHMTLLTEAIVENRGTVDKFMGDAIMAIFGAPLDLPDHSYYACRAAFRMLEKLRPFNKDLEEQGLPEFRIGVGISTGEVLVGNMGSQQRFNYSVLGNEVNVASRIEELNKQFGTNIIISSSTLDNLGGRGVVRDLGIVRVKGIEKEVKIFALSGIMGPSEELRFEDSKVVRLK